MLAGWPLGFRTLCLLRTYCPPVLGVPSLGEQLRHPCCTVKAVEVPKQ